MGGRKIHSNQLFSSLFQRKIGFGKISKVIEGQEEGGIGDQGAQRVKEG